ncbi:Hypothetical protein SRAE_0000076900 [Strongyloides ratti]|uniref:Uncharacterized protein n=1 Tax=Strongyloides ratti TaxID=34506 RepID=A0A090L2H2_STRRB|nr:Hypothetical protein SRAE_0000076900 [Strongyloides ratti]CEF61654.1 Hypothetical protein SRAE_0000076900 [Strongyloides ratti]
MFGNVILHKSFGMRMGIFNTSCSRGRILCEYGIEVIKRNISIKINIYHYNSSISTNEIKIASVMPSSTFKLKILTSGS